MNNLVPINQARAPSKVQQRMAAGKGIAHNFSDGIRDAFPVLSIKGKNFSVRMEGQTNPLIDPNTGYAVQFLDVVLANASASIAKSFYVKGFVDGDVDAPDCWSLDGIRPDNSVINKVSLTCQTCPMNAFGSRMTENGKAAKACSDARRVAVVMPHQLDAEAVLTMLLRIPQSSLKNLKQYAQLLERNGFEPNSCITRMSFDIHEAYPKLIFNFVAALNDDQYDRVTEIAEAPMTKSMLEAPDFSETATQAVKQDAGQTHTGVAPMVPQGAVQVGGAPVAQQQAATRPQRATVQQTPVQAQVVQPVQQPQPAAQEAPSTIIKLPDGKMFNTATGQYVEEAEAKQKDPKTIALPGGQFFNQERNCYVTGPFVGDPEVSAEKPKATRVKKAAVQEAAPAVQQETVAVQQAPVQQAQPELKLVETVDNGDDNAVEEVSEDDVKPGVSATPPGLDAILSQLLPKG